MLGGTVGSLVDSSGTDGNRSTCSVSPQKGQRQLLAFLLVMSLGLSAGGNPGDRGGGLRQSWLSDDQKIV